MDEMKAGISTQKSRQPEPSAGLHQSFGEIAGGKSAAAVNASSKHQGGKNGNDSLGERMLLKILQTLGLGLDVFRAVGQCLRQRLQVSIQDAGR